MEPKFQTSFIPKKSGSGGSFSSVPVLRQAKVPGTGLFMTLAILLFIISLAGVGAAYVWKLYLISNQNTYKQTLITREKQFNIDRIEQLKQINVQIDTAKMLLQKHLAVSGLFDILSKVTTENVRFLSLDVMGPSATSNGLKISLKGYGTSFSAVAFQSDVLGSLEQYGLYNIVKNPIIANPSLDSNGTVTFGLDASVDPSVLSYESFVNGTSTPGSN